MADVQAQIRWRSPLTGGLEHCFLKETAGGITLEGVAVPGDAAAPALRYRIVVDAEWAALRSVHLTLVGGATLALRHDGYGGWTDGEGKPRKDLQGVTDGWFVDSPALAMVLARRQPAKSKTARLDVAVIDLAAFTAMRGGVDLAALTPGRHWRATPEDGAAAEIVLGPDGILVRWGDRFERVEAPAGTDVSPPSA